MPLGVAKSGSMLASLDSRCATWGRGAVVSARTLIRITRTWRLFATLHTMRQAPERLLSGDVCEPSSPSRANVGLESRCPEMGCAVVRSARRGRLSPGDKSRWAFEISPRQGRFAWVTSCERLKPESTDGLGCAGCRARNGRFGGCGSGWWRWQGATVAVRACGQEETAVGRRSQACWRQAVERSARPSGVRSGAGSPAAGRGRR